MSDRQSTLAIVVPCYNEEEVLPISLPELLRVLDDLVGKKKISSDSYLLMVNDGSRDKTWDLLEEWHEKDARVCAVKLAKNCGHQSALVAGLMTAREDADLTVSIDADLQDDVAVIEEMVDEYHNGCEIVYGVRGSRKSDSFFKRTTAEGFYKLLASLGVKTVFNHADFRLMSRKALNELAEYKETNLYLRGLIPLLGLKTGKVVYERKERLAGESKYPLKKMLALALNGITSFSVQPIRLVFKVGLFVLLICLGAAVYAFASYITGSVERGWTSLILSIWFLGGIQLLAIGVIGEYIGKIYNEVKQRPLYHIETILRERPEEDHILK
ncbi:MAG: glycosyltransferase family 2 protein [Lachnospiraceae bacterium]|nr:glycosyltransferase family 2 protein [Lachnospiraceae bacterium]